MDMNFICLGIVSLLLMAIAIPLALQKVKPNRWYGVRTVRTFNDDGQWYRVRTTRRLAWCYLRLKCWCRCSLPR